MLKGKSYPLLFFVLFLNLALVSRLFLAQPKTLSLQPFADSLTGAIQGQIATLNALSKDPVWVEMLCDSTVDETKIPQWFTNPNALQVFKKGKHFRWNSMETQLASASHFTDKEGLLRQKNGYFLNRRFALKADHELIALIPIKKTYNLQNRYLQPEFPLNTSIPSSLGVSEDVGESSYSVRDSEGRTLFYLSTPDDVPLLVPNRWATALELVALAFLLMSLILLLRIWIKRRAWLAFIGFSLALLLVRWLSLSLPFPAGLASFDLFSPIVYASSFFSSSLGDLIINIALIFILSFVFYKAALSVDNRKMGFVIGAWRPLLALLISLGFLHLVVSVFKSLVMDSNISLDIPNLFSLDIYSVVALTGMSVLMYSFFLSLRKVSYQIFIRERRLAYHLALLGSATLLYLLLSFLIGGRSTLIFVLLWFWFMYFFVYIFHFWRFQFLGFISVIFWVVLFSFFSTTIIYGFIEKKDIQHQKVFAQDLAKEGDPLLETALASLGPRLKEDAVLKRFMPNPFLGPKQLSSRIKNLYLRGISGYHLQVYLVGNDSLSLYPNFMSNREFGVRIKECKIIDGQEGLYCKQRSVVNHEYLARYPMGAGAEAANDLLLILSTKTTKRNNVYPELLVEGEQRHNEHNPEHYAIYHEDLLVKEKGDWGYPRNGEEFADAKTWNRIQSDGLVHLVYQASADKRIVLSKEKGGLREILTFFSTTFFLNLLLISIALSVLLLRKVGKQGLRSYLNNSLRNRISASIIFLVILPFIIIVVITIFYFSSQYEQYHNARILRKLRAVSAGVDNMFEIDRKAKYNFQDYQEDELLEKIISISDIHAMDVNVFDKSGFLLVSSQPEVFERGLIAPRINPEARNFFNQKRGQKMVQDEQISGLDYFAVYLPLYTSDGEIQAYLNLPYYAKERELRQDIGSFLDTLINVYVFLLLASIVITYLVSNSITKSLSAISGKLRTYKLGSKNEPIEWLNKDDEIGMLVQQYNKMIRELDNSAERLAKSERESAWREMAKQVAHEIKNPLTPMKLSIQHLKRAYLEKADNLDDLLDRVSSTLIDQIDNLSRIASEFSAFAKMPKAINQPFAIQDTLHGVVDLFERDFDFDVSRKIDEGPSIVFADRSQILRVFTNILKNAKQALKEDGEPYIEVALQEKDGQVIVQVMDNGVGIAEDQKELVFVPNFTTKTSGMGLGLALSKNIIQSAGGSIWFESEEGKGTVFFIALPLFNHEETV